MLNEAIRDLDRINHINDYCDTINELHNKFNNDYNMFVENSAYQYSLAFCLIQIGELAGNLSDTFKEKNPTEWRSMKGLRNIIVHDYGHIDLEMLWETTHEDIKSLKEFCSGMLDSFEQANMLEEEKNDVPLNNNHKRGR